MLIKYFIIGIKVSIEFIISFIYHFFYGIITIITILPIYITKVIRKITKKDKNITPEDKNDIIPKVIFTLSIITYLITVFLLSKWYVQTLRNKNFAKTLDTISEKIETPEEATTNNANQNKKITASYNSYPSDLNYLNVDLTSYIKINSETVAWIRVNGTNINYPVVKHNNNDYYLNHNFYNYKTDIGAVFADYRDEFDPFNNNTIFYAHNLVNRTMFGQIPLMLRKNWQSNKNNYYIKLSTRKTNSVWQIFSIYAIKPTTDYLQSKFNDEELYKNFLTTIKNRSSFNFQTDVAPTDKIITLSTCDDIGTKRVAVHAKLIKIEDKK